MPRRYLREFKQIGQDPVLAVGLAVVTLFIILSIILPLLAMVGESASVEGLPRFGDFLGSFVYQTVIKNTIVMGLMVGAGGTLLGFLFAFVQVKMDVPYKRVIHIAALVPIISPPFAVAAAVIMLFGRSGMISKDIFGVRYNIYGQDGLTMVLILSYFTIAYLNLKGMLEALDPALDEAATNMGASKWHIFRTITLPMLIPGFLGSFLLLFVESIADLGNPLILGGDYDVLASRIYIQVVGLYDTTGAAVLSVILLVPSLTVFFIQRYWVSRMSVVSVTGKPSGTPQKVNHPLVRWPLYGLVMAIVALIFTIYLTIFAGAFTRVLGVNNALTLEHFEFVFRGVGVESIGDTTLLAVISTPIAGVLGILIAFLVVRKNFLGQSALDFTTMLGIAVPGTVLGIGYLLMYNTPTQIPIPFLGTPEDPFALTIIPKITGGRGLFGGALAIVVVFVVRSVPAALRTGAASLSQIDPSIEEASISLGADNARTFLNITLPLVRPAFFAGLIYAFARSMTSLSAIIFLTTPKTQIMTHQILNEVEGGRFGNAFAFCVVLIGIVFTAIGFLYLTVGSATGAERSLEGVA
ncbi:MAG: iron ABC transporter permease [Anaerolineae bacterium]|nr:iron ABC transporter permease [Anaerolineae bacterium]